MRRVRDITLAHRPSYWSTWALLVYVTLRYLAFAKSNSTFGDSTGYHESSHLPLISERFLAGRRSFPVPLYWKLVHGSETTITYAQLGLYPPVGLVFSVLPALEAQTRLMLGMYLEYKVTEKVAEGTA